MAQDNTLSPENSLGNDPLWKDDPEARAAYSDNPGFLRGTTVVPLTHKAGEFLLAMPEVAEGLEQLYRFKQDPENGGTQAAADDDPERIARIDNQLAMDGLDFLGSKSLVRSARLRRDIHDTRHDLSERTPIRSTLEESKLEAAKQRREAEDKAREETARRREQQVDAVAERLEETHPDVDFKGFFTLVGTLACYETPEGVSVTEYKGFSITINNGLEEFLADPKKLLNERAASRAAAAFFFAEEGNRDTYPIVAAFTDKIESVFAKTVDDDAAYDDLPGTAVESWFGAIDSSPDPQYAADTLVETGILQRTLQHIAHEDPVRFIDRLHTLAMRGLDPKNDKVAQNAAMEIIEYCLRRDAVAASSLDRGARLLETSPKAGTRQQALDLIMALEESGLPVSEYSSDIHDRLSDEEETLLVKAFDHVLVPENSDRLKEAQTELRVKALSPNGRRSTLLGRKLSAPKA
jgi:hypothetical protein